ncbi:hypothetical protein QQP08_001127, partial [Theobroma cacao]
MSDDIQSSYSSSFSQSLSWQCKQLPCTTLHRIHQTRKTSWSNQTAQGRSQVSPAHHPDPPQVKAKNCTQTGTWKAHLLRAKVDKKRVGDGGFGVMGIKRRKQKKKAPCRRESKRDKGLAGFCR